MTWDQISVRLQLWGKIKCEKPNDFSLNHHQIQHVIKNSIKTCIFHIGEMGVDIYEAKVICAKEEDEGIIGVQQNLPHFYSDFKGWGGIFVTSF